VEAWRSGLAIGVHPSNQFFQHSYPALVGRSWLAKDSPCLACLAEKLVKKAALVSGLFRIEPVPIHSVALTLRSAPARSVKSAYTPASDGGGFASLFSALRGCATAQSCLKGILPVHEVDPLFF
jgi:hypothetical protein